MAFPALAGLMGGLGALSTLTGGLQTSGREREALDTLKGAAAGRGAASAAMQNAQRRSSAISRARGLSGQQEQFMSHEASRQYAPAIAAEASAANQRLLQSGERQTGRVENALAGLGNALGGATAMLGLDQPTSQPGTQGHAGLTGAQELMGTLTGNNPATGINNKTEWDLDKIGLGPEREDPALGAEAAGELGVIPGQTPTGGTPKLGGALGGTAGQLVQDEAASPVLRYLLGGLL